MRAYKFRHFFRHYDSKEDSFSLCFKKQISKNLTSKLNCSTVLIESLNMSLQLPGLLSLFYHGTLFRFVYFWSVASKSIILPNITLLNYPTGIWCRDSTSQPLNIEYSSKTTISGSPTPLNNYNTGSNPNLIYHTRYAFYLNLHKIFHTIE